MEKIPDPSECVRKYVDIKYDNKPYPGIVENSGQSDIFVQCMHIVGKKDNNCFFSGQRQLKIGAGMSMMMC